MPREDDGGTGGFRLVQAFGTGVRSVKGRASDSFGGEGGSLEVCVRRSRHREWFALCLVAATLLSAVLPLRSATFLGNARVEIQSLADWLSYNDHVNTMIGFGSHSKTLESG